MSIWRHIRAIALLPFTVTVVIPGLIVYFAGATHIGWGLPAALRFLPFLLAGLLTALGLGYVHLIASMKRALTVNS
jgi:hypothetical protein